MFRMRGATVLLLLMMFGSSVGALEGAQVTMSYDELKKMQGELEQSRHALEELQKPATEQFASVTSARYEATPSAGSLTVVATLTISAFGKAPFTLPLFDQQSAIIFAEASSGANLSSSENGAMLRMQRPGVYRLKCTLIVPVENQEATFGIPPAGSSLFRLTLPGRAGTAEINPSGGTSRKIESGRTVYEAAIGAGSGELSVTWSSAGGAAEQDASKPGRVYISSLTAVIVERDMVRGHSRFTCEVKDGVVAELRALLPSGIKAIEVTGAELAEWRVRDENERSILAMNFQNPVSGSSVIDVIWEMPLTIAASVVDIARPQIIDVAREIGYLSVASGDGVELNPVAGEGLFPVDARTAPAELAELSTRPYSSVVKFTGTGGVMAVGIRRPESIEVVAARIDELMGRSVLLPSGREITHVVFQVRNSVVEQMEIRLPHGARVSNAAVNGRMVRPLKGDTDGAIRLPLDRSASSQNGQVFPVELVYTRDRDVAEVIGQFSIDLPVFSLDVAKMRWGAYLPRGTQRFFTTGAGWERERTGEGVDAAILRLTSNATPTNLNPFPLGTLDGSSVELTRLALDAQHAVPQVVLTYAAHLIGDALGIIILLCALMMVDRLVQAGFSRGMRRSIVALMVFTVIVELMFGGMIRRLGQGIVCGIVYVISRKLLVIKPVGLEG